MSQQQWTPGERELADLELILSGAWPADVPFAPDGIAGVVEVLDPEGLPIALLDSVTGGVSPLAPPQFGPFRDRYRRPADVRRDKPDATAVIVRSPPTVSDVAAVREHAASTGRVPVLLVCTGPRDDRVVSGPAVVRTALAAFADLDLVAVPLASRADALVDEGFRQAVAHAYADDVLDLNGSGELPDPVRRIVEADRPPLDRRGLVVFFTGLSGSGKSTLARALHDLVLERGDRTVTTLDGDVVRHHLSKGLGFSAPDRETNIERIGWVAAEIARHHGLTICSPIAPFGRTRERVRQMVERAGGSFVLIQVATPLAECERRDRKGLYAKARAGLIPEFTGISSPYEEPVDPFLRTDTTGRPVDDVLDEIVTALTKAGLWRPS